ncbi:hypothetical protein KFL_007580020 [Klebsormidium nitens]|uniref:Uncharacterized protein n=1 Tax=Klebsormidium nitens TaxID=105231 RepID=A0A1Y1IKI7_KLENI|nr:hypothetical protein KFL_007580020 [Klebsormidium nitens]|eukprot:GAQ91284.1 hypothetical protein KFL_007580020 [Klebsormidium nitens]
MASRKGEEIVVTALGELYSGPNERRYWSSKRGRDRYPYPVGYQATRVQGGHEYRLEVAEGLEGPDFVVTDPRGVRYAAETALRVWSVALRANGRAASVKENTDGGEIFGFTMVKKYLQDLVARTSGLAPGAPEASSTPLSPLACNTPTISGCSRRGTLKPAPKSLPAKRPASARRGRRDPKKQKGESPNPASLVGAVRLKEAGGDLPGVNPVLACDDASLTGNANNEAKRQKLGDLKFASPDGLRVAEAPPADPLRTEAALEESAKLGKQCSGRIRVASEGGPGQGAETEGSKDAVQKRLQLVPVEGKALLAKREELQKSLEANRLALARSRKARQRKLVESSALDRCLPPVEDDWRELAAKAEGTEGACQNQEGKEERAAQFGAEQEAGVARLETNEGLRIEGALVDKEQGTEADERTGSARHGRVGVFEEGAVRGSQEDGQVEKQHVISAGKRGADEKGSLGDSDAEEEGECETADRNLTDSAGRSKRELSGAPAADAGFRTSPGSAAQRPYRPADSPPSGARNVGTEAKSPGGQQWCPNHPEGDEHVPRTVDMEAETEPESDVSHSADLGEEGIGSGGGAEVESALADKAADVSSPRASEAAWAHESVGTATALGRRAEEEATGEEGLIGRKLCEITPSDVSILKVREGAAFDHHGGSEAQRIFEDDSTEPPDVFPASPAERQERENGPASWHGDSGPERKPGTVDFEADKGGWFTAARSRKGSLVGPMKEPVRVEASGGIGGAVLTTGRAQVEAAAGEKNGATGTLACDDRVIEETEQQEADLRGGFGRNGSGVRSSLGTGRSRSLGAQEEQPSTTVAELSRLNGNVSRPDGKIDGASAGNGDRASPRSGASPTAKALLGQGVEAGKREAAMGGVVAPAEGKGLPAAVVKGDSPVQVAGAQERKRKVKRLSLTPFKRWMATEEGETAVEGVCAAGHPPGEHAEGPAVLSGAGVKETKRKMGELKKLAAFGWEAEKVSAVSPGTGKAGREEQRDGEMKQLEPGVAQSGGRLRSVSGGIGAECGRPEEHGLERGQDPRGEKQVTGEANVARKVVPGTLEKDGGAEAAGLEGERIEGGIEAPGKPAVRIFGSDSLTEQQSEPQCSEPDAREGKETAGIEPAATTVDASAGLVLAGEDDFVSALEGGGVEGCTREEQPGGVLSGEQKEPPIVGVEAADKVEGNSPKASERDGSGAVRKGGLMPLNQHMDGPPTRPLSGRLGERGRPASPVARLQQSPKAPPRGTSSPPSASERSRGSSWLGRTVETISAAFRGPAGYKPLAFTRSRDAVPNGASVAPAPKDDTTGEGKARPRNKSWPIWTGPTSNPNLGKVGGSAQKAPLPGGCREPPEVRRVADVIAVPSALGANRGRALESQARRLGRFEESEAVRDWPAGEFLVPSTPPDTAAEEDPPKVEDNAGDPSNPEAVPPEGPEEGGLVPQRGLLMGGLESASGDVGQGLFRPVCCLVQQKGPVLWSVIHVAGQGAKLGVCVETDKAQRSVFVYTLSREGEQSEWKVDVAGEIAGTVRASEDPEQVASSGPFLQFSPDGDVLVLIDALAFQELSPAEAASKRPCLRLVSLVEQRPQLLARLDCGSTSSSLLVTGPRTLAAGMQQGAVDCWTMKPDWHSSEEKWTLPVARYRGVTFPAINHLLSIPGRPDQLLGCSENGSFAIWDVRARTLLSTCHSMHYLAASAAVLSGPVLLPREPVRVVHAGAPIHTTAEVHPQAEEADSVKPLCLLLRATARGDPEKGAVCLPALLNGDEIVVGKELLVAKRAVHVATLGASGVAADGEGRALLWDAPTGRTVAGLKLPEGARVSCLSTHGGAGILAVGCQAGQLIIYCRCEVPAEE